jgi:cation:H+ antiporter
MIVLVAWFIACALVLVVAGTALTRAADVIAERTGLGRVFVGALLLAGATSLPELSTDIAAVRIGAPNLAVGDLFGSSIANMLILALLTLMSPRRELMRRASASHRLGGVLAIVLTLTAAGLVALGTTATIVGVNPGTIVLLVVFLGGTWMTYRRSLDDASTAKALSAEPVAVQAPTLGRATMMFGVAVVAILLVAPEFAEIATQLADRSGLGRTFVGTWLLGVTTSMPELVSGIAAVRMRAYDLAVANVFGSNAFNMTVFIALDLVHPGESIFAALSPVHVLTALVAVALMAIAIAILPRRPSRESPSPG